MESGMPTHQRFWLRVFGLHQSETLSDLDIVNTGIKSPLITGLKSPFFIGRNVHCNILRFAQNACTLTI
jgi:hypothetical protein